MTERSSRPTVAVVDDDRGILQSLEYLLESADYAVRLFSSGPELLASGCLADIDCLISDIDMPDMDGHELLSAVRADHPDLPVILITGYPGTLKRAPDKAPDAAFCFTKPFQGPKLLAAVAESIRAARKRL